MTRSILVSLALMLSLWLPAVESHAADRVAAGAAPSRAATGAPNTARIRAQLAALALGFEPNRGQTARSVRFLAHGAGYTAFLTDRGLTLALARRHAGGSAPTRAALQLTPLGSRVTEPGATGRLSGTVSYFLGNHPAAWRTGIPRFARVTYRDLYPGIDLAVHGRQSRLEYDWLVHPGADPSAIRLALAGAAQARIDGQGTLVVDTAAGTVVQSRPVIYQSVAGHRQTVSGRALVHNGTVQFQVGRYNRRLPLIIDPILSYSTYLGGSGNDSANGIAVDTGGNAYVTGYTASVDFPVTPNAYKLTNQGSTDAFLTVINSSGSALVYSSYLGGSNQDFGQSVALDGTGDGYAYLTGYTYSTNFPTTASALQFSAPAEQYNAFATVVNTTAAASSQLVYSTYLGGTATTLTGTAGYGIAADSGHNAYITGVTYAQNIPTLHPFQATQTRNGLYANAFLIRLATNQFGAFSLVYGTYFGANANVADVAFGITTNGSGMATITGFVRGNGLPVRYAYQPAYGGGPDDAFVADFDTNATGGNNSLVFSTYLGGYGDDVGRGIATDGSNNYFLTGSSSSPNFPQTDTAAPVVPPANRGGTDVFVTKMHFTAGSPLTVVFSILIGGHAEDVGTGIGIDVYEDVYVTGYTASINYPSVNPLPGETAYQGGAHDAFVTAINAQGNGIVYSTYLGGTGDEAGLAIAVRGTDAFVAGNTTSPNFPSTATLSPHANRGTICPGQTTPCSDGFVARITQSTPSSQTGTVKGSAVCNISNHTSGTPACSTSPPVNCGTLTTCQLAIQVNAACPNPPTGYSCGNTGGRLGSQTFYGSWYSGGTSGTSTDGGSTNPSLQGTGFYGPWHGPNPNASFQFAGQDSDTGVPSADSDTFTLTISPINGATFPVTSAHWTCAPPSPPCSLEITHP